MTHGSLKIVLITAAIGLGGASIARADCESDLLQLDAAFKTPSLKVEAKASLDDAKVKAVAALHKDDDASCHKAIDEGMNKAGMKLK